MILEVNNLIFSYDKDEILHDVTFGLEKGEIVGLIGSNGAGKTTTLKTLIRKLNPESGQIRINGEDIYKIKNEEFPLTYVPDEPVYYEELTVIEHLQFVKALYPKTAVSIEKVIEQFSLQEHLYKIPSSLSKGTLQKMMISLALLRNFNIFVADEPFNGIDPSQIHRFKQVLFELKKQDKAVLVSTHLLDMAEGFCDKYIFLHNGKVLACGSQAEIIATFNLPSDYSLEQIYMSLIPEEEKNESI